MRSLIIHNIRSGFGTNAIYEFQRELLSFGDECVFRCLEWEAPIDKVLYDAEEFDLVVVSGGDGTVTNALYTLRNRNVPTCVFPSGTANLLFSNLGNAPEPAAIAAACQARHAQPLDLGELRYTNMDGTTETKGFGVMSGMGFDAQLMQTAEANKQSLGGAAYFAAVLQNLNPPCVTFTITVDGKTYKRTGISCIVCNTSGIQGDINILPGCTMDDGLLDVMVLATTDAVQLLVPVLAGIFDPSGQTFGRPLIERFTGAKIRVESSEPLHIQSDGDASETLVTAYEATCLPSSNLLIIDEHSPYYTA